jgi:NADH dehydrogenase/NADH:ubiquinone oxidoreductase subunit G
VENAVIIQKCFDVGIDIPCFCYHESLSIAGNRRMCLVEISTSVKLVASCAMPIADGMKVFTNTIRVKKARESVLEFLLVNHPLDCPICDQGGECDLQDITMVFGSDQSRFYETAKRAVFDKNAGSFVKMIMTRCIHCTRCVRFLNEICDSTDLGMLGRGVDSEISSFIFKVLNHELSANVIDLCPVGALTSKPYSFSARPWELNSIESIDILDSMCSNIRLDYLNNKLMRILPIYNKNLNED